MCVSAVTEELIAAGSIETVKDSGTIRQTIKDEEGRLVSENRFAHMSKTKGYNKVVDFYRLYDSGEMYKTNLVMTIDYENRYTPDITVKGVGQFTATEVKGIINTMMWDEWEVTETKTDKYGFIESLTFKDSESIAEEKRFAKSQEMANQLITA